MRARAFPVAPALMLAAVGSVVVSMSGVLAGSNSVTAPRAAVNSSATDPDRLKDSRCTNGTMSGVILGSVTVTGTAANDLILGSTGADTISGLGGNDCLLGGAGADIIDGGLGSDVCIGGPGVDVFVSCEVEVQ